MKNKISVVIPCYNVEKYIVKCLESVLAQTYSNLEVIVVNDGSTDATASLVERFVPDSRVKFINQANAGVSAARNAGMAAATGELLAFVDSDDYLELSMYEKLLLTMTEANADMAVCNYNLVYDDHVDMQYSKMERQIVDVWEDVYSYFARFCACPRPNNYIWTRLYKTEMVKKSGIVFEQYKLGDDTLFNFKLLPHISRVAFTPEGMYNYFQRSNSNVYTVANKGNLARIYADTFEALESYWRGSGFDEWLPVLSLHAASRLRSVFFYSRLAGQHDEEITRNVMEGFQGRSIADYLTGVK
ncbi:MAG: glycosyltransferase [Defluviitaleaceae bacterium]|nr:glycosyltransferase [Defluviitaleaceae bacterium]MCL2239569.1 glycosyltransferase [Defluviitaleaceae bacterium]